MTLDVVLVDAPGLLPPRGSDCAVRLRRFSVTQASRTPRRWANTRCGRAMPKIHLAALRVSH